MTGITHIFSIIKWKPTVYVTAGVRSSSWALIGQSMLEINFLSAGHFATFIFARQCKRVKFRNRLGTQLTIILSSIRAQENPDLIPNYILLLGDLEHPAFSLNPL